MDNSAYVQSVLKALRILDIFGFDDPLGMGFSLSELSRRTGLAPNTLCKILKTMVRADYLTQDSRRRYHSSHKICMTQVISGSYAVLPEKLLKTIRDKSRHLAMPIVFATLSFGERKIILQTTDMERKGIIIHHTDEMDSMIYTKPTGRILVSYANSGQLNDILGRWGFPEDKWDDIHDLPQLIQARSVIRKQSFCVRFEAGDQVAMAIPINIERCNFLGALGSVLPMRKSRNRQIEDMLNGLRDCAEHIAVILS